jgi:hypothetical protein
MEAAPAADVATINAEANRLVIASVSAYPWHQARASVANFVHQMFDVGVTQYAVGPLRPPSASPGLADLLTAYPDTPAGTKRFPFGPVSAVMLAVYVAALALVGAVLALQRRWPAGALASARRAAVGWLITGLVANAAVNGVISGVFDRYQGRVAWLALLAALALVVMLRPGLRRTA